MDLVEEEDRRRGRRLQRAPRRARSPRAPPRGRPRPPTAPRTRRSACVADQARERRLPGARAARRGSSSAAGPPRSRVRSAEPSPSRCSWPTNSSSVARAHARGERLVGGGTPAGPVGSSARTALLDAAMRMAVPYTRAGAGGERPRAPHDRAAAAADPVQHGQPARQRAGGAGVPARHCSRRPASSASCSPTCRGRPNLVARLRGALRRPGARATSATSTRCWPTPPTGRVDPWSGELRDGCVWGRGALDMKSQVAAEVAAALALRARRAGGPIRRAARDRHRRRGGRRDARRQVALRAAPRQGALRLRRERGRRRLVRRSTAAASTASCVAEKGVFRFTLTDRRARRPRVDPADRRQRADRSWRRSSRRCASGRPVLERSPEPEALLRGARRSTRRRPRRRARGARASATRAWRVLVEPMLGVTLTPTMIERLARRST